MYITQTLAARGKTPWAVSLESGAASGWPGTDWIEDIVLRTAAEILKGAEIFRFDASDLMPAAVGAGAFSKGVPDYVSGVPLDRVLQEIEAAAKAAYGT